MEEGTLEGEGVPSGHHKPDFNRTPSLPSEHLPRAKSRCRTSSSTANICAYLRLKNKTKRFLFRCMKYVASLKIDGSGTLLDSWAWVTSILVVTAHPTPAGSTSDLHRWAYKGPVVQHRRQRTGTEPQSHCPPGTRNKPGVNGAMKGSGLPSNTVREWIVSVYIIH